MVYIGLMNNHRIAPRTALATILAVIVSLATVVIAPGVASAGEKLGPPAPSAVALAAPATQPTLERKFAAGDYVHLANCQSALTGANGDNDIAGYLSAGGYGGWGWSAGNPYWRQYNTRLVVYFDVYKNGSFDGSRAGYCMGDDSNIVDKAGSAPAGW